MICLCFCFVSIIIIIKTSISSTAENSKTGTHTHTHTHTEKRKKRSKKGSQAVDSGKRFVSKLINHDRRTSLNGNICLFLYIPLIVSPTFKVVGTVYIGPFVSLFQLEFGSLRSFVDRVSALLYVILLRRQKVGFGLLHEEI